jgi:TAG lipase/lysophosphatidylethanolamine acyltransferase
MFQRLYAWWTKKSTKDVLLESVAEARVFEEWEGAAFQLDEVLGHDLWYYP